MRTVDGGHSLHFMPNVRSSDKRAVRAWVSKAQYEALQQAAKDAGFATISSYLAWVAENPPIARNLPENPQPPKRQR